MGEEFPKITIESCGELFVFLNVLEKIDERLPPLTLRECGSNPFVVFRSMAHLGVLAAKVEEARDRNIEFLNTAIESSFGKEDFPKLNLANCRRLWSVLKELVQLDSSYPARVFVSFAYDPLLIINKLGEFEQDFRQMRSDIYMRGIIRTSLKGTIASLPRAQ